MAAIAAGALNRRKIRPRFRRRRLDRSALVNEESRCLTTRRWRASSRLIRSSLKPIVIAVEARRTLPSPSDRLPFSATSAASRVATCVARPRCMPGALASRRQLLSWSHVLSTAVTCVLHCQPHPLYEQRTCCCCSSLLGRIAVLRRCGLLLQTE